MMATAREVRTLMKACQACRALGRKTMLRAICVERTAFRTGKYFAFCVDCDTDLGEYGAAA